MFNRTLKKALTRPISVFLVLIVIFFLYTGFLENKAEKKAKEFCAQIKVGDSTDGLIDSAFKAGAEEKYLKWQRMTNESQKILLMAMFVGGTPFSRHFCDVEAIDQRVVNATYSYLD